MVIISTIGTKGGVGKTTLTANLGALIADMGLRVLLVDADIQASLSKFYELKHRAPEGLTSIIRAGRVTEACISATVFDRLDIIVCDAPSRQLAASQDGTDLERFLQTRMDAPVILRKALRSPLIDELYDFVLIDTPGAQGPLLYTAALAAHRLITPVLPETPSAREFKGGTLELLRKLSEAEALGIVPGPVTAVINRAAHTNDARQIISEIRQAYYEMKGMVTIADTVIPTSVLYNEAATERIPVHLKASRSRGGLSPSMTMHSLVWELIPPLKDVYAGGLVPADQDEAGAGETP